jgi:hypothetical protein
MGNRHARFCLDGRRLLFTDGLILSPQFDLFSVRAGEYDAAPASLARLARRGIVGRADQFYSIFLELGDGFVKVLGFQAEVKTGHRPIAMVR